MSRSFRVRSDSTLSSTSGMGTLAERLLLNPVMDVMPVEPGEADMSSDSESLLSATGTHNSIRFRRSLLRVSPTTDPIIGSAHADLTPTGVMVLALDRTLERAEALEQNFSAVSRQFLSPL